MTMYFNGQNMAVNLSIIMKRSYGLFIYSRNKLCCNACHCSTPPSPPSAFSFIFEEILIILKLTRVIFKFDFFENFQNLHKIFALKFEPVYHQRTTIIALWFLPFLIAVLLVERAQRSCAVKNRFTNGEGPICDLKSKNLSMLNGVLIRYKNLCRTKITFVNQLSNKILLFVIVFPIILCYSFLS